MRIRHLLAPVVMVYATLLSSYSALAQFSQQGSKLVGAGASGNAFQGYSVSLSADGNTAIVGGYADNSVAGAAWVWTRSGGVWTQQAKLVGSGAINANQGYSVSLSADGNTALVGGASDNASFGAAWVWTRSGGVWTQQGAKLVGSGAVLHARQGVSVALSGDGNTAIVGGYGDDSNSGAAWVWIRSGGVWSQQGPKLFGSGAVGNAQQGASVALSGDGNTAVVGGFNDNGNAGAAWIWTRSGGVWTQQGNKLVSSDGTAFARQGLSVSLSADGNTAVVGGDQDNGGFGAAWIWTRSGAVWTRQSAKLVGSGAVGTAHQGSSVSLSADGNAAIVGGSHDNNTAGAAWVWTRSGAIWSQQSTKLVGSGAAGQAGQGASVWLSGDGNTVMVGGYFDSSNAGAAWVFNAAPPRSCPTMTPSNVFISYHNATNSCITGQSCAANEMLTFSAQSFGYDFSCATHSFSWSFGDGSVGLAQQQVTHSYASPGSYTAVLVVTNPLQTFRASNTITVTLGNVFSRRHAVAPPVNVTAKPIIVSLSSNSATPLQQLILAGSGFDSAATTSVNFSDLNGYSVTVLAIVPNAKTVIVSVPAYQNTVSHLNSVGTVNVEVIVRTLSGATVNSNIVSGFHIATLPALTLPPGTVTAIFLTLLRLSLSQVQGDLLEAEGHSNGQLSFSAYRANLDNEISRLSTLETILRSTISGMTAPANSSRGSGGIPAHVQSDQVITFDQSSLKVMDQILSGVFLSNATVSGVEPSKGGIECYTLLKDELQTVVTQAGNPQVTLAQRFDVAKALGGCAQAEMDSARQFGAATSLALLAMGPAIKAAIAAQPELALAPGLLGWATVAIELYMLVDARDIACAADHLYPGAADFRKLCVTANEEIAKAGIEPVLGDLVELIRGGNYVMGAYEALDSGYELIPKSKNAVVLLEATDLWPRVLGISCSPGSIAAGSNATCTVTISFAPLTSTVVVLTNNHPEVVTVPPSVTLGEDAFSGKFTITGAGPGTAAISAGGSQTSNTAFTNVTVNAMSGAVSCTYGYSDWSACQSSNTQTRTVVSRSPAGCVDTPPPVLSQACSYTNPSDVCCMSYFDSFCTVLGPGGCWREFSSTYVGGVCQIPQNGYPGPYLSSPGPCKCNPNYPDYAVCN